MIWDDNGFLLSKNRYNENSLIIEVFTKNHGKVPGIVFGGTSKKIKNYLQIGNDLYVNFNTKSETSEAKSGKSQLSSLSVPKSLIVISSPRLSIRYCFNLYPA